MLTYIVAWFPMLLLAILNGILREALLKKWVNDATAHQLSTLTLILFFSVYIYYVMQRFPPVSGGQALLIGFLWMLMTLLFEFGFGFYRGNSFDLMLADYNLLAGRLWVFIPLCLLVAPYVIYLLYHKH